ncbi:hypothetical protein [Lyngbya confervoides]|uniref:Uncharacterized protein n=1 Tax=Lyngbya confervoides BDU141951 TaxID=1574623 RepID=A0ABD4T8A1_9CYAN|nr:hypothetical protein [Lyngbya confervoides]MCM1984575.1 hypothetical protein [Lyngbya confervoides BDU141951]
MSEHAADSQIDPSQVAGPDPDSVDSVADPRTQEAIESLARIREILTGEQIASCFQRIEQSERTMQQALQVLEDRLWQRLDQIQQQLSNDIQSVTQQLESGMRDRQQAEQSLREGLGHEGQVRDRQIQEVGRQIETLQTQMRQALEHESQQLNAAISHQSRDILARLDQEVHTLIQRQTQDQVRLAQLLEGLAQQILQRGS